MNLDCFHISLGWPRPLLLQLCCHAGSESERKAHHSDNRDTNGLLRPLNQCSHIRCSIFSWVKINWYMVHWQQSWATLWWVSLALGFNGGHQYNFEINDLHWGGSVSAHNCWGKDWVKHFGEDSRDFLALWNTQWLHLAKRKKKIIYFFFAFWWTNAQYMTGGDRVYFCLHLTQSISQDQVVLRSCCQTGTFILRFRSSGNILCKLSTSFALEHFLRLLPFLWWYHTVKLKTLNNKQTESRPGRTMHKSPEPYFAGCSTEH